MQEFKISDIAIMAGVSPATVDRVLNDRGTVRQSTRDKVLSGIEQLRTQLSQENYLQQTGKKLTFILPAGAGPSIDENLHSFVHSTAAERNIQICWRNYDKLDHRSLSSVLNSIDIDKCLGVVMQPLEHTSVASALGRFTLHNIPCICLLSEPGPNLRACNYIGLNNFNAGETAGYLMTKFNSNTQGRIAIVGGVDKYWNHKLRVDGFKTSVNALSKKLTLIPPIYGNDEPEHNHFFIEKLLKRYDDLTGIYNVGSGNRGIVKALIEAEKAEKITFFTHNLTSTSKQYLLCGAVDAIITPNYHQIVNRIFDRFTSRLDCTYYVDFDVRFQTNV
ncbi:LacI family DNA-binding transcriptional regulator [Photobacterium minamisatsumaniensis]|uniref:LacI family DNA-binding transcriptional regulator n=1 Tax=Photobacterium minamisatsumaniensis TaxID=2910233 RepID=UPI003D111965